MLTAHWLMRHLSNYYVMLIPVIVLGILFGLGLNFGAKIGRCSRFSVLAFLFVLFFSLFIYTNVLFFNHYHDTYAKHATLGEELLLLTVDSWNMLDAVPFVADYVDPITDQTARDAVAGIPVLSSLVAPAADAPDASQPEQPAPEDANPAEQPAPAEGADAQTPPSSEQAAPSSDASLSAREHIGRQLLTFLTTFPARAVAEEPVVIGTVFHVAILEPVRQYLQFPGVTKWDGEAINGRLLFDERAVKPWMAWSVEWLFVWLLAVLIMRSGTKTAYANYQKRLEKKGGGKPQGLQMRTAAPVEPEKEPEETPTKGKKAKSGGFSLFGKKKNAKDTEESVAETEQPPAKEEKPKKKKSGGIFGFGKKKTEEIESSPTESEQAEPLTFSEEAPQQEQRYALILHQYNSQRQDDLVRLLQQIGQVSEESAKKLLKTPSLIKRDVNTQQANIAIQKFQQVQAQVKLITMEQLAQLQNKQRPAQPTPPPLPEGKSAKAPAPQKAAPGQAKPVAQPSEQPGDKYALILRKFDQTQRKQVVELLSSLSNTPVAQLQQSLKTPALVLRDASKDEVMMIAQQFQKIQAETKMLTMAELQKLTNKSG